MKNERERTICLMQRIADGTCALYEREQERPALVLGEDGNILTVTAKRVCVPQRIIIPSVLKEIAKFIEFVESRGNQFVFIVYRDNGMIGAYSLK